MLYTYSNVIPFLLILPVVLNIILPMGMLMVYLILKLILLILHSNQGEATSKPNFSGITEVRADHQ